jgi:hypothetical protein
MVGKSREEQKDPKVLGDEVPKPPQGQETQGRPQERDDRTPEQRAGSDTEAAEDAAQAQPTTPPAARTPEPVEVRQTTMTTLGEVMNETRPGFDAGGTPVVPNSPPRNRIAEIGDYPRTYEEAVLLERHRRGEVDEYGRTKGDENDDERAEESTDKREVPENLTGKARS